ncbi:tetratricopeptide repeat protein [Candidatus Riflebacteria bacterium]
MKHLAFFFLIFIVFSYPVQGNSSKKLEAYLQKAKKGDLKSQIAVGNFFLKKKAYKKAGFWFMKAAKKGNPYAQYRIGQFYEKGAGKVKKNMKKAVNFYKKSAAKKFKKAIERLKFLKKEFKKKKKSPAKKRMPPKENSLALSPVQMLMKPLSPEKSFQNGIDALKNKDLGEAISLLQDAANGKYLSEKKAPAHSALGLIYLFEGIPGIGKFSNVRDLKKAKYWLRRGADLECLACQSLLAQAHYMSNDFKKAFFWYDFITKAAGTTPDEEKLAAVAYLSLANMYHRGQGVEKDPNKFKLLLENSVKLGNPAAKQLWEKLYPTKKKRDDDEDDEDEDEDEEEIAEG